MLFHADAGYWNIGRTPEPKDWLDTSSLYMDEKANMPLTEYSDYKDDFAHLREANKVRNLRVFVRDSKSAESVRKTIRSILLK